MGDGLLLQDSLPWSPIVVGVGIGVVAVIFDIIAGKFGVQLPAVAFAVGIYLPAYLGVGMLIGTICRYAGEHTRQRETGRRERTHESMLAAAGMITGSAALDLILGIAVLFGFDINTLRLFSFEDEAGKAKIPEILATLISISGIIIIGAILFYNARNGTADGATGLNHATKDVDQTTVVDRTSDPDKRNGVDDIYSSETFNICVNAVFP